MVRSDITVDQIVSRRNGDELIPGEVTWVGQEGFEVAWFSKKNPNTVWYVNNVVTNHVLYLWSEMDSILWPDGNTYVVYAMFTPKLEAGYSKEI